MGIAHSAHSKSQRLCKKCQDTVSVFRSRHPQNEDFKVTHIGPITDLLPDCRLCQLIRDVVAPEAEQSPSGALLEVIRSEPVKRYAVYPDIRHPWKVFCIEYAGSIRGCIGLLSPDNYAFVIRQSHELAGLPYSPKIPLEPLQHLICSSDQQVSIGLIRKWLLECEKNHGAACNSRELFYPTRTGSVYAHQLKETLLIDVVEKRLVSASLSQRYIALSYVWGKINAFQTKKANRDYLGRQGALCTGQTQPSQTIRDAMELVKALGERYLWVDALCIVQDDASQKHDVITRMHEIYDAAIATIVALSGRDADSGLPGLRARSRQAQRSIEGANLQFIALPPPLEEEIKASYWESRAWTLQERMLSRKLIYFSASQMHFQCQECVKSEVAVSSMQTDGLRTTNTISMELSPDRELSPLIGQWVRCRGVGESRPLFFPIYSRLVQQYTMRNLSYEADILNAFSGIMMHLQNCYGGKFFSCLPEASFDLALLWVSGKGQRRRPAFPTWSWTSWVGRVSYIHEWPVMTRRLECYYPTVSVENFVLESEDESTKLETKVRWERSFGSLGRSNVTPGMDVGQRFSQGRILLTFKAWVKEAREFTIGEKVVHIRGTSSVAHPIIDPQGKHCGILFSAVGEPIPVLKDGLFAFALISVNQKCEPLLHEPSGNPIKIYDEYHFSPHCITANTLLINSCGVVAKRVTVAQIQHYCWLSYSPQLMTIQLE
jgi:hypothetical protein